MVVLFLALLQLGVRDAKLDLETTIPSIGLALIAVSALGLLPFAVQRPGWIGRHGGSIGLLLLVGTVVAMPSGSWPGPQTVLPVIGTLLVLSSPHGAALSLLRSRLAGAVGGISYPLYLWHWPGLVFLRLMHPHPGAGEVLLVLACSVALAWVTKSCIEEPIRFGRLAGRPVYRIPPGVVAAGLLVMAGVGWTSHATNGLPQRFPPALREIANWSEPDAYGKWRLGECYFYLNETRDFAPACSPPPGAGAQTVLLWGDSHAAHLYLGLAAEEQRGSIQLAQWTMGSCPSTLRAMPNELPSCTTRRAKNWRMLRTYAPDVVILSAAWNLLLHSGPTEAELAQHIQETVEALRSHGVRQVIVFGDGPVWDTALPAGLYRHMARHFLDAVPDRFGRVPDDLWNLDRRLQLASEASGARYFSVLGALCNDTGCRTVADRGKARPDLMYWDKDHLTPSGARLVIDHARPVLLDALDGACARRMPAATRDCPEAPRLLSSMSAATIR